MAKSILLPTSIKAPGYNKAFKAQRKCYEEARPPGAIQKAAPDAPRLWAPLLYDVYLKLNLGKEFEEISKYNPACSICDSGKPAKSSRRARCSTKSLVSLMLFCENCNES